MKGGLKAYRQLGVEPLVQFNPTDLADPHAAAITAEELAQRIKFLEFDVALRRKCRG
jgi:hypothetical protein